MQEIVGGEDRLLAHRQDLEAEVAALHSRRGELLREVGDLQERAEGAAAGMSRVHAGAMAAADTRLAELSSEASANH